MNVLVSAIVFLYRYVYLDTDLFNHSLYTSYVQDNLLHGRYKVNNIPQSQNLDTIEGSF